MRQFLTLICLFISSICLYAQNSNFVEKIVKVNTPSPTKKAVYLDNIIKKNISVKETTELLQQNLEKHSEIVLPNRTLEIDANVLKVKSNQKIWFQDNTYLKIKPNNLSRYIILNISKVENVEIFNPQIIGDRYNHLDKKGEWGFGLRISASKNIKIYNANIQNTWGDGISLARENNICNENILLNGFYVNEARRNGITIGCGRNISVQNVLIVNTGGTNPQAGIDIEPDNNNDILENIQLKNIQTYNNKGAGIIVSLKGLIGKSQRNVSISIDKHIDYGSKHGFALGSSANKTAKDGKAVKGVVKLLNSQYNNNTSRGIEIYKSPYNALTLDIVNPKLQKGNKKDIKSISAFQSKIKEYYNK